MAKCAPGQLDVASIRAMRNFQKSFRDRGITADFRDRRGTSIKPVILGWQASGPKSYLAGRPQTFAEDSEINAGIIKGIEVLSSSQLTVIPSQPATDFIDAKLDEGFLFLQDDCNNEVAQFPLSVLCKAQNGNKLQFTDMRVRWSNCYVMFPAASGISQANSLMFLVYLQQ